MNNKKQIGFGAIISYVAIIVNIFVGLLYTPWMVKQIGKSQYGLYTLANSLITLFLVDFGLSAAAARYVSNYHAEGKEEQVEVVVAFKFKDTNQEYIVYTKNEKDSNGNVTVYVSRIVEENGISKLDGIDDDDEWTRIKAVLRELAKDEQ